MSRIRANQITNQSADGAPTVQNGLVISGVTTSTTFSGSGASLTSLPAANLTGTLPAISGANLTSLPSQLTLSNNADNRVITGGSGVNLNGEANLIYNGTGLGVGETSPANLLHVKVSDVGIAPHGSAQIVLERSGTNYLQFLTAANGTSGLLFGDANDIDVAKIVYDHNVPAMQFVTETVERLRIHSNGDISIGDNAHSSVTQKVDIRNGADEDNIVIIRGADITSEYAAVGVNGGNAVITGGSSGSNTTGIVFRTAASGTEAERLYITGDGKIGINLSNPGDYNASANNLVVHSSPSVNDAGITIRSNYAGTGGLYFADGTGTSSDKGYIAYGQSNDTMYFGVNRGGKLQINSSGAFGLAGANYGSSGQVLTSQGSGSAVQWATPAAATNSPCFSAYRTGDYTHGNGSESILQFNNTRFNTGSCYSTGNYRFTPNVAGSYVFHLNFYWFGTTSNKLKQSFARIKKNGNTIATFWIDPDDAYEDNRLGMSVTAMTDMNGSNDYVEAYGYSLNEAGDPRFSSDGSLFGGFKLA